MFLKAIFTAAGICGGAWAIYMGVAHRSSPHAQTLIEDRFGRSDYVSGYAGKYLRFLSGVDVSSVNDWWWHWAFFYRYKKTEIHKDSGFYGKKNPHQLRIACKEAYGGKSNGSGKVVRGSVSYGEEEIWRLCSPSSRGLVPKTMQEAAGDKSSEMSALDRTNLDKESKWNSKGIKDIKENLLSIHHPNNNWVWSLIQRKFNKEPEKTGFFAGSKNGRSVKDKCEKVYSSDSSADKQDILKWCGL